MIDRCISCGAEVPEGRFVCVRCEMETYPIFCEFKNAVDYGHEQKWDAFRVNTLPEGGYVVEPVYPTGYNPIGRQKVIKDCVNSICTEYCKYPDEYSSLYCDDSEEAEERCAIERCENCPISVLKLEAGLYDD